MYEEFEFETFEVRIRRAAHHKPLPIGATLRTTKIPLPLKQFKTVPKPIDAAQRANDLLPSTSLQGLGLMRLHSGARPESRPAALPSGSCGFRTHSNRQRRVRTAANRLAISQWK